MAAGKAMGARKRTSFIEDARRKQILGVALESISREGYRNTSVEQIAARAGISKGVVYYHFKTKQELVGQIWTALIDELFAFRKARVDLQNSATQKLQTYVEAQFEFMSANLEKFVALSMAGFDLTAGTPGNPWSASINKRCFAYLGAIIKEGWERGEFLRPASKHLAPVIQGAIDGIALEAFSDPEGVDLRGCQRELLEMITAFLAAGG